MAESEKKKNTASSTSEMVCKAVCKTTQLKRITRKPQTNSLSRIGAAKHMCEMFFGNRDDLEECGERGEGEGVDRQNVNSSIIEREVMRKR